MSDRASRGFLEACGVSGPMVLGLREPGVPATSWRAFDRPFAVVGRDPNADLPIRHPDVSRRHAYIQMVAGRPFCVDLRSRTGTRWGDEPGLWGWVDAEVGVGIGPYRLRSRGIEAASPAAIGPADEALPISRSFEQPRLPGATLEFLGRSSGPPPWRFNRSLVLLGGSSACKVRMEGGGVAQIQASLVRTPEGIWVVNLLGPGGVLLNEAPMRFARLGDGDILGVGSHRLRVNLDSADEAPTGSTSLARVSPADREVEILRQAARAPAIVDATTGPEAPDLLLRTLLGEFGRMQREMADQFQQSLMLALQSFEGVHREQAVTFREELARIRELAEEQSALQARLEGRRAPDAPPALRLVSGESAASTSYDHYPGRSPAAFSTSSPPVPVTPPSEPERDRPASSNGEESAEFHAQVFRRLSAVQDERQGRWQKLLESFLGKGT